MNITSDQVAQKAASLLLMNTIPYTLNGNTPKGMDCQGLVEWTLGELGMEADYRGTNDMWRNLLYEKGTIEQGVARYGAIPVGALIFIVDHDGGEPSRYQGDGEGNAWHVYVKIADDLLIHASASHLQVCTRSFHDQSIPNGGPNAYGLITGVEYGLRDLQADAAMGSAEPLWKPVYDRLTFAPGCMGGGVREIQTGLNLLGNSLAVDGRFGPLTTAAVIAFQSGHSLTPDGVVGAKTWAALVKAANDQGSGGHVPGSL